MKADCISICHVSSSHVNFHDVQIIDCRIQSISKCEMQFFSKRYSRTCMAGLSKHTKDFLRLSGSRYLNLTSESGIKLTLDSISKRVTALLEKPNAVGGVNSFRCLHNRVGLQNLCSCTFSVLISLGQLALMRKFFNNLNHTDTLIFIFARLEFGKAD